MPELPPPWEGYSAEIRFALDRIIASPGFSKSPQLTSFLRFVVHETLNGRGEQLKAYTIAVDALGRDSNFDPQNDPIVRVEAGRVRRALENYYAGDGRDDPIVIELPRGGYAAVIRSNIVRPNIERPNRVTGPLRALWERTSDMVREHYQLILLISFIAAMVSLAVNVIAMLVFDRSWTPLQHTGPHAPPDGAGVTGTTQR